MQILQLAQVEENLRWRWYLAHLLLLFDFASLENTELLVKLGDPHKSVMRHFYQLFVTLS